MNALEKAKAIKALQALRKSKPNLKGLALAKALKQILELRTQLGMGKTNSEPAPLTPNPLYQSILDGKTEPSIDTLKNVIAQAENDPSHWQLPQVADVFYSNLTPDQQQQVLAA